jgi:hypothetical protein
MERLPPPAGDEGGPAPVAGLVSAWWVALMWVTEAVADTLLKATVWLHSRVASAWSCCAPLLDQALFWLSFFTNWLADMASRLFKVLAAAGLSLHLTHGLPQDGRSSPASAAAALSNCKASTFSAVLAGAGATIETIAAVARGGSFGEGAANIPYPTNPTDLPELCALVVRVPSSPASSFRLGLFLPTTWAGGRFLAVGNGGFAGGIPWIEMGPGAHYGMATVATDTGHSSSATDMRWALNKPEAKSDWGWRAMSGSVALGKKLTEAYYASPIRHSYYNGCSSGGRQGLKQIQIAPDTFDGILVGAPAWWTSHMNPFVVQLSKYNLPASSPGHMTFTQFGIIANEVLRQCDRADGVADLIISAPDRCTFSFDPITCGKPGVDPSKCITAAQVRTAKNVYGNWTAADGSLLHPGLELGSEWNWLLLADESEAPFGLSFVRYFLYDDPSYPLSRFNETVVRDAERLNPGDVTADRYDLSAYKSRGGKIVMWHGLADGVVTPKASELYYARVADAMGGMFNVYPFFRYFPLPGVQHCWGTPLTEQAPWMIAGAGQASAMGSAAWSVPGFGDADHDALLALVRWVENGTAVDSIVATNWASQLDASTPVLRQRPLCPWPRRQVWGGGAGNVNRPDGWTCV